MILDVFLAALAGLSLVLLLWQWLVAQRFPLHRRVADRSFAPGVTVLKPLKGCDEFTESCLRSWLAQDYAGAIQVLFGVASADDPVCEIVKKLLKEFPERDAQLVVCEMLPAVNNKVGKLACLEKLAQHEVLVISDSDVRVPPDFLANLVAPLREEKVGLTNSFYELAGPVTVAMRWEATAVNADFWSQVLQSRSLKPMDFALGPAMATRRRQLAEIGGFAAIKDCLADDYQLGNRLARRGYRVELCPVVAECWSAPMSWRAVWKHQLRWARTIRVCEPAPYFFSVLSNATLWPLVWLAADPTAPVLAACGACWLVRWLAALDLQRRLTRRRGHFPFVWLVPVKDLLQFAIWLDAFAGSRVEWRGSRYRVRHDGTLVPAD